MSSLQCRELLAKNEVLKKEPATSAEESKNCTNQESNGVNHSRVLSHFACGRQRSILLKSQADRILAKEGQRSAANSICSLLDAATLGTLMGKKRCQERNVCITKPISVP